MKLARTTFLTSASDKTALFPIKEIECTASFLKDKQTKSVHTLRQYEKELHRLYWFMNHQGLTSLSDCSDDFFRKLISTLKEPGELAHQPDAPFYTELQDSSLDRAMNLLSSFFEDMNSKGIVAANPLKKKPWKISSKSVLNLDAQELTESLESNEIKMVFPKSVWARLLTSAKELVKLGHYSDSEAKRINITLMVMYGTLMRVEEFALHGPHNINMKTTPWRMTVLGKGDKVQTIPVLPDAQVAIQQLMLHALWTNHDERKLSFANSLRAYQDGEFSESTRITTGAVYKYLKKHFDLTQLLVSDPEEKLILSEATPHWIRHTGISHLVNDGKGLRSVQLLARHSDINTTASYAHSSAEDVFNALI